jgi:hypothetical protein
LKVEEAPKGWLARRKSSAKAQDSEAKPEEKPEENGKVEEAPKGWLARRKSSVKVNFVENSSSKNSSNLFKTDTSKFVNVINVA